jgi:chromosome segregation ATPase
MKSKNKDDKDALRQYEYAAKESINSNPDTFKPKTMDVVLTKVEHLERKVGELHDHIMPNEKMRWPGMYIAIKELTENIGKLEKIQENEVQKYVVQEERVDHIEREIDDFKKDILDLKQKILIKEVEERTIKEDESKRLKGFEFKLKWVSGLATIISIIVAALTIYNMLS